MGQGLGEEAPLQRQGAQGELVQPAILELLLEQPVEGEQGREEGHGPEQPGGDARQQSRLRPDPEGEDHHRQQIEGEGEQGIAALAQHQGQIPAQQAHEAPALHATMDPSSSSNALALGSESERAVASGGTLPP